MNATAKAGGLTNPYVEPKVPFRSWLAYIGCLLGAFMAILDIQVTNSSIRDIQGALNATTEEISWISTAYLVAEIIVIPISGWLCQVFSIRKYLFLSALLFVVFSVLCAFSWNINSMIVFRALQGLSGGVMIPTAFIVMIMTLPPSKRPVGGALFGFTATFAPTIGPTFGGWLTNNFGWQYIFFINVVPGILMLSAIWFLLKQTPTQLHLLKEGDWSGMICMAIGLGSMEVFLEEGNSKDWFNSQFIVIAAILAVVFLTLFIWIELTKKKPFINLRLLKRRNFGMSSVVNMVVGLGLYGSVFILPLYLGQIQGYNALEIGKSLMWVGLPQFLILPFLPKLIQKVDIRILIMFGVSCFGGSCLMNAFMTNATGGPQLIISQVIRALGQPLIMIPLTNLATADIEPENAGSAAGLFNMMRNLGGSVGIALLSTFLTKREQFHSARITEGISLYSSATQQRIDSMTQFFVSKGSDAFTAKNQAITSIGNIARREAFVLAFNDCFLAVGLALFFSGLFILFAKKVKVSGKAGGGGH